MDRLCSLVGFIKIRDVFPIWAIVAIVGTILCMSMLILTDHYTKPRYHAVMKNFFALFYLLCNQFVGFCISWFCGVCRLDLFSCQ